MINKNEIAKVLKEAHEDFMDNVGVWERENNVECTQETENYFRELARDQVLDKLELSGKEMVKVFTAILNFNKDQSGEYPTYFYLNLLK